MSRKSRLPQGRHHVMLYTEDWEFLVQSYGPGSAHPEVGPSGALKEILHQRVQGMKAKINGELDRIKDQNNNPELPEPGGKQS